MESSKNFMIRGRKSSIFFKHVPVMRPPSPIRESERPRDKASYGAFMNEFANTKSRISKVVMFIELQGHIAMISIYSYSY